MAYITGTVLDDTGTPAGGRIVRAYRRDTGALLGSTTSASSAVTGDSNLGSVVLLLNGAGTNGSTTITDTSPTPKTITAVGNAQISTAQSKYGGSSLYFDGVNDNLEIAPSNDFAFGTSDFTIELWLYVTSFPHDMMIIDMRPANTNGNYIGAFAVTTDGTVSSGANNATKVSSATGAITTNAWHHVALCRSGTTERIFINGYQSGGDGTDTTNYETTRLVAGQNTFTNTLNFFGYIDDLRITKGVARYTASFTPPTAAFPDTPIDLATGDYYIQTAYTGEVNVVCLDDSGGTTHNDRILRTTPV